MVDSDDDVLAPRSVDGDVLEPKPVRPDSSVSDVLYHYCVVRLDLPRGTQAAQLIHAAGESACLAGSVPPGTNAVALGVPCEARLLELGRTLAEAGIAHAAIVETEGPFAQQTMAIGCAPSTKAKLKKYFSSIPLIKEVPAPK